MHLFAAPHEIETLRRPFYHSPALQSYDAKNGRAYIVDSPSSAAATKAPPAPAATKVAEKKTASESPAGKNGASNGYVGGNGASAAATGTSATGQSAVSGVIVVISALLVTGAFGLGENSVCCTAAAYVHDSTRNSNMSFLSFSCSRRDDQRRAFKEGEDSCHEIVICSTAVDTVQRHVVALTIVSIVCCCHMKPSPSRDFSFL